MTPDQNLSDLAGKPGGYPADWSPVCGDQLALYYEWLGELRRQQAELIGVSADGVWCHDAYAQHRDLDFPLLAGFVLSREATVAFGSKMGLRVRPVRRRHAWSDLLELAHQIAVNPGADGTLQALEKLPKSENLSKEEGSNVAAASTGALD